MHAYIISRVLDHHIISYLLYHIVIHYTDGTPDNATSSPRTATHTYHNSSYACMDAMYMYRTAVMAHTTHHVASIHHNTTHTTRIAAHMSHHNAYTCHMASVLLYVNTHGTPT